jgi:hypothetical protein
MVAAPPVPSLTGLALRASAARVRNHAEPRGQLQSTPRDGRTAVEVQRTFNGTAMPGGERSPIDCGTRVTAVYRSRWGK